MTTLKDLKNVLKGQIFNTAIAATTNFFTTSLAPFWTPSKFNIYICMSAGGTLTLTRKSGATTITETLNGGTALTANVAYQLSVMVDAGETVNLQYSAAATILKCNVCEVALST